MITVYIQESVLTVSHVNCCFQDIALTVSHVNCCMQDI